MYNITKKLHAIMSEISFIAKDKKNDFHGYAYASEQAIKETVHPLLVKHKVLFSVQVTGVQKEGDITTAKLEYTFTDVDTRETYNGEFYGTGQDKGDKGLYKAITGGIKYIFTSTFVIPTGDDPENEAVKKPQSSATKKTTNFPDTDPLKDTIIVD